ncbi:porin [Candidatus Liberibacter africanus]|uniref:Porin n=1 Tax=Candidatus Liberibacter africanus PTSAPSY TaxID=1277257 RepID=A0A0G3I862_LIBAF|nr:porin [Candidatus Liberibacter africanus]AKK19882.1 outer membrane protein [Candidatus Liberibacter africanus PTSAPSY]QTP63736.1 porin [Candidatus Liberibacter africanus]
MKCKKFFLGSVAVFAIISYSESFAEVRKNKAVICRNNCEKGYSKISDFLPYVKSNGSIGGSFVHQWANGASTTSLHKFPIKGMVELGLMQPTIFGPIKGNTKWNMEASDLSSIGFSNPSIRSISFTLPSIKFVLDQLYVSMNGLKVGHYTPWSDEVSSVYDSAVLRNVNDDLDKMTSLAYQRSYGSYKAGISVDLLQKTDNKQGFGLGYMASYALGNMTSTVTGGYDVKTKNIVMRGNVSSSLGNKGTVDFGAIWASGANSYYDQSRYSVFGGYKMSVLQDVSVSLGGQYFWKVKSNESPKNNLFSSGVEVRYDMPRGLQAKTSVNYKYEKEKSGIDLSFGLKKSF